MRRVAGALLGVGLFAAACGGEAPLAPAADAGSGSTQPDAGPPNGADAGPSADCAGIAPASLSAALTFDVPQSSGKVCSAATSDGTGMIVAEMHDAGAPASDPVTWQIFDSRGAWQGNFGGGVALVAQPAGYQGYSQGTDTYWDGYGNPKGFVPVEAAATIVPAALPGTIAFGVGPAGIVAHRVDGSGLETGRADGAESSALTLLAGAQDQSGAAVALFSVGGLARSMWLDFASGKGDPAADLGLAAHEALLRPLLGGGVAVRIDGRWAATLRPHDATLYPPPPWLRDGTDFSPVRGGKAYAVWKGGTSALDLILPQGSSCGTVTFPGVTSVSLGMDGTVIGASGPAGCTKIFWHSALK